MEEYLRLIKVTADSLAAINHLISDVILVHYTITGLPPSYESFVTTISYMSGLVTFDDLRSKLVFYEHRVRQQHERESAPTHQAYTADRTRPITTGSSSGNRGQSGQGNDNGNSNSRGRNNNKNKNRNNNRGNRNNNNHNNSGETQRQQGQNHQNHHPPRGNSHSDGVLGSHPSTMCHICHFPGHCTGTCPD